MSDELCKVCNWREGFSNLQTSLGTTPICIECFEAKAETPVSLHEAVQWADKHHELETVLRTILKGATVFRGRGEGYVSLAEYHLLMSQQQLVVMPTAEELEDERTAANIIEMQRRIVTDEDFEQDLPPLKMSIWQKFKNWFWRPINGISWGSV